MNKLFLIPLAILSLIAQGFCDDSANASAIHSVVTASASQYFFQESAPTTPVTIVSREHSRADRFSACVQFASIAQAEFDSTGQKWIWKGESPKRNDEGVRVINFHGVSATEYICAGYLHRPGTTVVDNDSGKVSVGLIVLKSPSLSIIQSVCGGTTLLQGDQGVPREATESEVNRLMVTTKSETILRCGDQGAGIVGGNEGGAAWFVSVGVESEDSRPNQYPAILTEPYPGFRIILKWLNITKFDGDVPKGF